MLGPCNQGLPLLWTWVAFLPCLRPPGCRHCLGALWRQRVGPLWCPWPRCRGEGTLTGSPSWTHNRWCYLFISSVVVPWGIWRPDPRWASPPARFLNQVLGCWLPPAGYDLVEYCFLSSEPNLEFSIII